MAQMGRKKRRRRMNLQLQEVRLGKGVLEKSCENLFSEREV